MKNRIFSVFFLFIALLLGCSKNSDGDKGNPTAVDKTANLKATGDSANDILANDSFDKLLLEIGYVEGFAPTSLAMTDFEAFIKQHTFKADIEITYKQLSSPNEEKLTLEEIADLEKENRTAYNDGTTLAMYIYFADAPSEDDVEEEDLVTLGAVYFNTSMIIYESTIRSLAGKSNLVSVADIESATLNHEFGHLMGLVNLGTDSVNDHEGLTTDDDGNEVGDNHCTVSGCLMRAELQFGGASNKIGLASKTADGSIKTGCSLSGKSVLQMLEQQATSRGLIAAPDLGVECILDLQTNGGR